MINIFVFCNYINEFIIILNVMPEDIWMPILSRQYKNKKFSSFINNYSFIWNSCFLLRIKCLWINRMIDLILESISIQ